jgi:hypothetical protein
MSKYRQIIALYESTVYDVTNSPTAWTAFLRSACRNYKCRFDEQVLIYAQRPDATAVLEMEKWNKQFGRWVNRGAKGIAVFDDEQNGHYRLKHYFDISDTHGSRFERHVPIWKMMPEYEAEIIESLENSFGDLSDKSTLVATLISAAINAVKYNKADYLRELAYNRESSMLAGLNEFDLNEAFHNTVQYSVAYMLLTRCGFDTDKYIHINEFRYVPDFNTRSTINALGLATSDIAEMCLREIAATVLNLQRQEKNINHTFAKPEVPAHNVYKIESKGGFEDARNVDISDGGRLQPSEPGFAGGGAGNPWQIRVASKGIPETASPCSLSEPVYGGGTQSAPDGDRTDSQRAYGVNDPADGSNTRRDGGTESLQPDAVGGIDEQYPAQRGGKSAERPNIRIKPLPTVIQQLSIFREAEEPAKAEPSAPSFPADTPRILYKRYLSRLVEEIRRSEINPFLRDRDTLAIEAETVIGDWLDTAAKSDAYPGLFDALSLPDFREWLIEDILDRTYQDVSIGSDGVVQHENNANSPDWVKLPPLEEQIREDLSLRGFAVSVKLIEAGIIDFHAQSSNNNINYFDIIDYIERISGAEYIVTMPSTRRIVEPVVDSPGEIALAKEPESALMPAWARKVELGRRWALEQTNAAFANMLNLLGYSGII